MIGQTRSLIEVWGDESYMHPQVPCSVSPHRQDLAGLA